MGNSSESILIWLFSTLKGISNIKGTYWGKMGVYTGSKEANSIIGEPRDMFAFEI